MKTAKSNFQYKRYHIPNVVKTIAVLNLLSKNPKGMTQLEISKATGFTISIVFRLLATLQDYECVEKNPSNNAYTISNKFVSFAYQSKNDDDLFENSIDIMREVRDTLMETTMLGVLLDNEFIMIQQQLGRHSFNFTAAVGMKAPLHTSAPAKAVIAFLPEVEKLGVVGKIKFERYSDSTVTDKKAFLKILSEIKNIGYATDNEEYVRGMNCVGAPIFNACAYPVAALWVTGPSERLNASDFAKCGEYIAAKAMEISKRLGFSGNK